MDTKTRRSYFFIQIISFLICTVFIQLWGNDFKYTIASSMLLLGGAYYLWVRASTNILTSKCVVVLTGCDSGLGYSLAIYCKDLGSTVIAGVYQTDSSGAQQLLDAGITIHSLDITDRKSIKDFANFTRNFLKKNDLVLSAIINNAGVMIFGEFEWLTEDQISYQVEVNLIGTIKFTKEFMPEIRAHRSRIILISSHCSIYPLPGIAVYGATKSALQAWATSLRIELKKYGINVVSFIPGSFFVGSNIMSRQREHFNIMEETMSEEAKHFYGDYFSRYVQYLTPMAVKQEPKMLNDSQIYNTFKKALLKKYPSPVYKCEPWRYFFYHTLFGITPTFICDQLILRFMKFPSWEDKSKNVSSK